MTVVMTVRLWVLFWHGFGALAAGSPILEDRSVVRIEVSRLGWTV
jgi:hypothetical protein